MFSLLLGFLVIGDTSTTWTVDREATEIVRTLKDRADDIEFHFPPELVALVRGLPIRAVITLEPQQRHYTAEISLTGRVNRFLLRRLNRAVSRTTVDVMDGKTTFTTTVDLSWGTNGCLVRRILNRIESAAVLWKRRQIESLVGG